MFNRIGGRDKLLQPNLVRICPQTADHSRPSAPNRAGNSEGRVQADAGGFGMGIVIRLSNRELKRRMAADYAAEIRCPLVLAL